MTISGKVYTERAEAGEALLQARKAMKGVGPEKIGSYRGLEMQISFDSFNKEFKLIFKGSNTHIVPMGDSAGNIMRLDNAIDKMTESLQRAEERLTNLLEQMEAAKEAIHKPFPQEAEYQEKIAKLAELDAILNTDDTEVSTDANEHENIEDETQDRPAADTKVFALQSEKSENTPPVKPATSREQGTPVVSDKVQAVFDRLNEGSRGNYVSRTVAPPSNAQTQPNKQALAEAR